MRGIKLTLDGIAGAPGWVLSHDTMYSSNVHQQQLVPHCPCRRYVLDVQQATCHHLNIYTKHFSETLSCSMSRGALKTKQGFSISPCHCPEGKFSRLPPQEAPVMATERRSIFLVSSSEGMFFVVVC